MRDPAEQRAHWFVIEGQLGSADCLSGSVLEMFTAQTVHFSFLYSCRLISLLEVGLAPSGVFSLKDYCCCEDL